MLKQEELDLIKAISTFKVSLRYLKKAMAARKRTKEEEDGDKDVQLGPQ